MGLTYVKRVVLVNACVCTLLMESGVKRGGLGAVVCVVVDV